MNAEEIAMQTEMLRRRNAHQDVLARAGYKFHVDAIADNCLHVETDMPGTTIDVYVVNLKDIQEESEITYTTGAGTGQDEITEVAQVRDHFVSIVVDGLIRFLEGR